MDNFPSRVISSGGRGEGGRRRGGDDDQNRDRDRERDRGRDRGRNRKTVDVDYYDPHGRSSSSSSLADGPYYAPSANSPASPNSVPFSQRADHHHNVHGNGNGNGGGSEAPSLDGADIYLPATTTNNGIEKPANGTSNGVIVRGEEIGIVVVVLLLWVGAIILFFNRWGKIRMLEPYQPKFCESHRPSCPMAEVTTAQQYPRTYSKFNISTELMGSPHFAKCNYHGIAGITVGGSGYGGLGPSAGSRPRQNSVFVTSPHTAAAMAINSSYLKNASRKTKSAIDLSTLVLSEEFLENVRRNSKNSITHL